MLIPSCLSLGEGMTSSLSRRVNANSQLHEPDYLPAAKLIKKGEC